MTVGGTSLPNPVDVNLPLVAGQGLQITNGSTSYFIRCLPSDFPTYSAAVTGQPQQANGYFLTLSPYSVVFDTDGVPVWWYRDGEVSSVRRQIIDPSTIVYSDGLLGTYSLRGLDGSLKLTLGGGSNPLDFHDLQQLPNGNYLGIMDVTRNCPADPTQCVDLSSWGLSSQSAITDNAIVELNPANQIVWQWSVADHINVATANVNWHDAFPDVVHMNSILYDGNGGIIFSARQFDAVYRIDMATGAITWKLGGSTTPQSLNVVGDQYAQLFSGQHFARLQPDGSLTVHDNGTRANRQPPRCASRSTRPPIQPPRWNRSPTRERQRLPVVGARRSSPVETGSSPGVSTISRQNSTRRASPKSPSPIRAFSPTELPTCRSRSTRSVRAWMPWCHR